MCSGMVSYSFSGGTFSLFFEVAQLALGLNIKVYMYGESLRAGSSPRLAGSDNSRWKVSDRWFYPALDTAVHPLRAAVPQVHGPMKLVKRHRTIYFRAE